MSEKLTICIIGSGNWATSIAKIIGKNAKKRENFNDEVYMYVYEEYVNGKQLSDIINETHENVLYLPGHYLPDNVIAINDIVGAAFSSDILVFAVPHKFVEIFCSSLMGKIKPTAVAVSLVKGIEKSDDGVGIDLISHVIHRILKIPCSVLMGVNLAYDLSEDKFCQATLACRDIRAGPVLKEAFQSKKFRIFVVDDVDVVELCNSLKDIIAIGAGFIDGLGYGENTKAALIRLGLMEIIRFVELFYPGCKLCTFFESCCLSDLITACYGGKNRKVGEAFVKRQQTFSELENEKKREQTFSELENELLNGQKLEGPVVAQIIFNMLKKKEKEEKFMIFVTIYAICIGEWKPEQLIDCLRLNPDQISESIRKL